MWDSVEEGTGSEEGSNKNEGGFSHGIGRHVCFMCRGDRHQSYPGFAVDAVMEKAVKQGRAGASPTSEGAKRKEMSCEEARPTKPE